MLSRKNLLALLGALELFVPTTRQQTVAPSVPPWGPDSSEKSSYISDGVSHISSIVVYKDKSSAVTPASSTYITGIKFNGLGEIVPDNDCSGSTSETLTVPVGKKISKVEVWKKVATYNYVTQFTFTLSDSNVLTVTSDHYSSR